MPSKYTPQEWKAFHAEAVAGMRSGKYSRIGEFCAEKGFTQNLLWYSCRKLGLETNFKAITMGKKPVKSAGKQGSFVEFAPVQTQMIEMVIDGRIKIMVPRNDLGLIKVIGDSMKEAA